jgi:hypothetical protein
MSICRSVRAWETAFEWSVTFSGAVTRRRVAGALGRCSADAVPSTLHRQADAGTGPTSRGLAEPPVREAAA